MSAAQTLHFHLPPWHIDRIRAGKGGILNRVVETVEARGWTAVLQAETETAALPVAEGHHLVLNRPVIGANTLTLRRCLRDPFWRIEATNDRWDWQIARKPFRPGQVTGSCGAFMANWRGRIFGDLPLSPQGHVLIPLQGKLLEHRHFQSMSPIGMIRATLAAEPDRPLIASLHPKETYSEDELAALAALIADEPRLTLATRPTLDLLAGCDYVVTQNSSTALTGYFAEKPAVLFGRIDFHHIAGSVPDLGVDAAFARALGPAPAFARYLFWYFKRNSIIAWADDVQDRIADSLRMQGWPI